MESSRTSSSLVPGRHWLRRGRANSGAVDLTFLLAMTGVGAALRLVHLTSQSLWVDEMLTWSAIQPSGPYHFWSQFLDTIQGPLYLAAAWPLLHMQDSTLMLRIPAVIAGIATVPLFGWLAFRASGDRAARLATLLFAVNPFHIWYSQEGRGYAFLILCAVAVMLLYMEMVSGGASWRSAIGFGLSGAALLLCNLSGVFLLSALALTVILCDRPTDFVAWRRWVVAFGLAFLVVVPWFLRASGIWAVDRLVPGAGLGDALRGATTFSPLAVPYSLYTFFFGYSLGPSLRELHQPDRLTVLMNYLPVLGIGAVAVGAALLGSLRNTGRGTWRWWLVVVVPLILLAVLALRNVKPWNPRYAAVALPALVLIAGQGLAGFPRRWGFGVTVILLGLTMWSLVGYYTVPRYRKADVERAVAALHDDPAASGAVLVPVVTSVFAFYDRGEHRLLDTFGRSPLQSPQDATAFVEEVLTPYMKCAVVLAREWYFDPQGYLLPALARIGTIRRTQQFPGVAVFSWTRANRVRSNVDHGGLE